MRTQRSSAGSAHYTLPLRLEQRNRDAVRQVQAAGGGTDGNAERAVGILAGIWAILFALPLFFVTPDSPSTSRSAGQAISQGLRNLGQTIRKIRIYRNVGTAKEPRFDGFTWFKTGEEEGKVPTG